MNKIKLLKTAINKLNSQILELEEKTGKNPQYDSMSEYIEESRKLSKEEEAGLKTLYPIIKVYKRDRSTIILPNKQRVKIKNIQFIYTEDLSLVRRADGSFRNVRFKSVSKDEGVFIYYTFTRRLKTYQETCDLLEFQDPNTLDLDKYLQLYKNNDKIEELLIYGNLPDQKELERFEPVYLNQDKLKKLKDKKIVLEKYLREERNREREFETLINSLKD